MIELEERITPKEEETGLKNRPLVDKTGWKKCALCGGDIAVGHNEYLTPRGIFGWCEVECQCCGMYVVVEGNFTEQEAIKQMASLWNGQRCNR